MNTDRNSEIIDKCEYKEAVCFTEVDENGLLITLDDYHEVLIPKDCLGFTDRAYEDLIATASLRIKIDVEEGNPKYQAVNNCLIEVQSGKVVLGCKNSVIPDDGSIKIIGAHSFNGVKAYDLDDENIEPQEEFTTIKIPEGVEVIEHHAFADSGLTDIEFPYSLTEIGSMAFMLTRIGMGGKRIMIPYTVERMGIGVFTGCTELRRPFIHSDRYISECDCIVDTETNAIIAVHSGTAGLILAPCADKIETLVFMGQKKGTKYYFEDNIKEIKIHPFGMPSAIEFPITMVVNEDSYAHQFAMEHNIPFEFYGKKE